MKIISWRGWEPEDDDLWLGVDDDVWGQWRPAFASTQRNQATSVYTGVTIGERTIGAEFGYDASVLTFEAAWQLAMQRLNPLDTSAGRLVVAFNDAPTVYWACDAHLNLAGSRSEGSNDSYDVTWITADPVWHAYDTVAGAYDVSTDADVVTVETITNPAFASDASNWTKGSNPATWTTTFAYDASIYNNAVGSGKLDITANTTSGIIYVMNDDTFAAAEGSVITVRAARYLTVGLSGGAGMTGYPVVQFYDVGDNVLQTNVGTPEVSIGEEPATTWWVLETPDDPAPANTTYAKIGMQVAASNGVTGACYIDDFEFVTAPYTTATVAIGGNAPTNLTLTLTPQAGTFPQAVKERHFTITNNGTKTLHNFGVEINMGDNSASEIEGTYSVLLRDGKPQPCQVGDYDAAVGYLWFIVDYLPAGETTTFQLLASDQTGLPGDEHTFTTPTAPVFDIDYVYATTTTGSTSTVTQIPTGLGSEADKWIGATMIVIDGAQAGTEADITDSSTTTLTHAALAGGALASGVHVLVKLSSNERWVYAVRKTERSAEPRGLWWLSSGQKKPSDFRMDTPGSWSWDLYYDNEDRFNQKPFTAFDPGGGNDYVAILDANRTWHSGSPLRDEGGANGVSIHLPVPITAIKADWQLKNPNSMAMLAVVSRQENGATEWTHENEDTSASTTLSDKSIVTITLEDGSYGVGMFLIPNGGDVIGDEWVGAEGTATGGSSTTLTDSTQEWIADQFNGGWVKIISGDGAGQYVAITDTGTNSITVASWPNGEPTEGSHYRIINRDYVATARNHTYLHLELDPSDIEISAVSDETDAYVIYRDIVIDQNSDGDPYQRLVLSPDSSGRFIVLLADQSLVINGDEQRAYIADSATGAEIEDVPPPCYYVLDVLADGTTRAAFNWLRVTPGDHTIGMATDEQGIAVGIDVAWIEAVYA